MADSDLVREGASGLIPPASPSPSPQPPVPGPSIPARVGDETVMSLVDHLSELRRRLAFSLVAVGIGSIVGFYFAPKLITFLKAPLNLAKPLVYTGLKFSTDPALEATIRDVVGLKLAGNTAAAQAASRAETE